MMVQLSHKKKENGENPSAQAHFCNNNNNNNKRLSSAKWEKAGFLFCVSNILFSNFSLQLKLWEFKINILACELLIDTRKVFL